MSKKFKAIETNLTVTNNNITCEGVEVGDYALAKHNTLLGNWVAIDSSTVFDASDVATLTSGYNVTGSYTQTALGDTHTLYGINVWDTTKVLLRNSASTIYSGMAIDRAEASINITGGNDIENPTLFAFISKYWTRQ